MSEANNNWLSLNAAARRLGVHPTTLRRWANSGEVPVMLTPGGHRRFAVSDIDELARRRRQGGSTSPVVSAPERSAVGTAWAERAIQLTRREIGAHTEARWMTNLDDEDRQRSRQIGQRLMGLTLQYVSALDEAPEILVEAQALGHEYGATARTLGLPLTDALQAALFFRDALVEAAIQLPETAQVRSQANKRLLRRINAVLNAVQLAVAEVYES